MYDKNRKILSDAEPVKLPTSLYTTEATLSREKVEEELKVPDPTLESAQAVFSDDEEGEACG